VAAPDKDSLQRRWVHSHEEDTEEEMVFRPATHPFPPSRGRASFDLRPGGHYLERSPGPVDVPEESEGRWSLEGDRLLLRPGGEEPERVLEVTSAAADRLVVRRPR
jgi:hypothetical protein